jgi:ABC-type transport system involved in multi-copper enzyme maturation permease subunit
MTALAPSTSLPGPRLVSAELLKLRKRRGLVATTSLLTIGSVLITTIVLVSLHAANAAKHGPAGGIANLGHLLWVIGTFGSVAGILIGATTGSSDVTSGVFKELVVTGRSRRALFAARIPGGLAFLLPFVGVGYLIAALSSVAFAGSLAAPSTSTLLAAGLWALVPACFWFFVALGFSSLLGSRTTPVAILLPFHMALSPLLVGLGLLGQAREALPIAAFDHLLPHALAASAGAGRGGVAMSTGAAIAVLLIWIGVSVRVGAWRTETRDA